MKRSLVFVVTGTAVVGTLGVGGLAVWANRPSVTRPEPQANVQGVQSPDYATKLIKNAYFTASIAQRFSSKSAESGTGKPVWLQELYTANNTNLSGADQLAITVAALPTGGLNEVSAIQYRTRSAQYEAESTAGLSEGTHLFSSETNGYEIGAFVPHGKFYTSIVMSGAIERKEQLSRELHIVLQSLTWN